MSGVTKRGSNSRDLKVLNRLLVRNTIRRHGPIARYEVAQMTGLTPPTVTVIVNDMLKAGIVKEVGRGESTGGRRPVMLELNPRAGFILAVKVQRDEVVCSLLDLGKNVLGTHVYRGDTSSPEALSRVIRDAMDSIAFSQGIAHREVLWCGVAFPGLVDPKSGAVARAPNLGWENVEFGSLLKSRLEGIPVHVENISNAAALGEKMYGSGQGCANLIYINLSVGIGAGIIVDNEVFGGARGYAGEVGHVAVVSDGPRCSCGRNGCFEAVCGTRAVLARLRSVVPEEAMNARGISRDKLTIEQVVNTGLLDVPEARKVIEETGRVIGLVVGNLLNLFNSEMVILGGELARTGDVLLEAVRSEAKMRTLGEVLEPVRIVRSTMQEDPALMGAYAIAAEDVFAAETWERTAT